MTGDRACVQDESPLLLHHDGNNLTSRPEHGFDIRIHDPIPFCLGVLMNRLHDTCTSIIHHHIQSPKREIAASVNSLAVDSRQTSPPT